jgi:hypothetical protein
MREIRDAKSDLYMHIWQGEHDVQGMGIWEKWAFVLHDTGICSVYDLECRSAVPLDVFRLGSYNEGVPSKDYRNHANSCMFSTKHYRDNEIPLLYVTIGTGIGMDEDGYFYRCAVEDITRQKDKFGAIKYTAQTLQTISYHPAGIEQTPWKQPCWGCPAFLVDSEDDALYIFSAQYRTKRGQVPEGEHNRYIVTKFSLPPLHAGKEVRLGPADIIDQFDFPSDVQFTQGGTIFAGKLYYTFGCPRNGYPLTIMVVDLRQRKLSAVITDLDGAMNEEELECCAFYQNKLLCNTCADGCGSIFTVEAALA